MVQESKWSRRCPSSGGPRWCDPQEAWRERGGRHGGLLFGCAIAHQQICRPVTTRHSSVVEPARHVVICSIHSYSHAALAQTQCRWSSGVDPGGQSLCVYSSTWRLPHREHVSPSGTRVPPAVTVAAGRRAGVSSCLAARDGLPLDGHCRSISSFRSRSGSPRPVARGTRPDAFAQENSLVLGPQ